MNGQQNGIYDLLRALEESLDKGFPLLSNYMVVVKREVVESLLDRIYASLPTEVQDARSLLRRRDEIQHEAQQRAEKIINDAQNEESRLLSESDLLLAVQKEADKIKEQVIADCEEIKRKALDDAEAIRIQAQDDAVRIQDGASVYAEQVLTNLEQNLNQLQQIVKNGQVQLERRRNESTSYSSPLQTVYPDSQKSEDKREYATNFKID